MLHATSSSCFESHPTDLETHSGIQWAGEARDGCASGQVKGASLGHFFSPAGNSLLKQIASSEMSYFPFRFPSQDTNSKIADEDFFSIFFYCICLCWAKAKITEIKNMYYSLLESIWFQKANFSLCGHNYTKKLNFNDIMSLKQIIKLRKESDDAPQKIIIRQFNVEE